MTQLDREMLSRVMYLTADYPDEESECHVCGEQAELTDEHVPPFKAYNDYSGLFERLKKPNGAKASAYAFRVRGGFTVPTLCARCNNVICSPYAEAYVKFVRHLVDNPSLFDATGRRRLVRVPSDALLVAKEIATMILAREPASYGRHNSGLRHFVMNREATFAPNFRVLAFLVPEVPEAGTLTRFHGRADAFAPGYRFTGGEISWFPFGFVYATEIGCGYSPETLTDITRWFTRGNVDDRLGQEVRLFCRTTGVDSIQCGVGRERIRPQIDYLR